MTSRSKKTVLKRSSVDVLDHKPSSEIKDEQTTCTGKSEKLSTLEEEEKQLDNNNLQRPRSIFSIKYNIRKEKQLDNDNLRRPKSIFSITQNNCRPITINGLIINKPSMGTTCIQELDTKQELDTIQELDAIQEFDVIQELDHDAVVDASLNYSSVSEQNSSSNGKNIKNSEASAAIYDDGCIECVKAIPVFNSGEIDEGDHIVFAGMIYDHHAIVVKKRQDETFEIVEATNTGIEVATGVLLCRKALIKSSVKSFNFATDNLHVVVYNSRKHSKNATVECARNYCNETAMGTTYKYNLFDNNCEHFATFCVTGKQFSIQVTKLRLTTRLFFKSGFQGISNEMKRNEKEFENRIICEQCFNINKMLLDVKIRPIKKAEDVQKGDIIRYSYWHMWHEAVVLSIESENKSYLKCYIAHYAFCGLFSYRTIIKEKLNIYFDGTYAMLEYGLPKYDTYDPGVVVERAHTRIGEQLFVFFSNDSSHFARWCKLKLKKKLSND